MWIRSQDRKALLNVNQVLINPSVNGSIYYINDSLGEESNVLGIYTSEEKALKVLDEIQRAVGSAKIYSTNRASNGHSMSNEYVMVYQMPQDEDVF